MKNAADVCLLLEGSYPYVAGGVSTWVHNLIQAQDHVRFAVVSIQPQAQGLVKRYELPDNVVSFEHLFLHPGYHGERPSFKHRKLPGALGKPLLEFLRAGGRECWSQLVTTLRQHRLGSRLLLESRSGWDLLCEIYEQLMPRASFLDFFWSWRTLVGSLASVAAFQLPQARVYHAVSTGYAGLLAARAKQETGRVVLLTEHGIYTNERRIEIAMADWLHDDPSSGFDILNRQETVRDLWINAFNSFSRACYQACDQIITLYRGNQMMQIADGAPPERLRIIPNGVDVGRLSAIPRESGPRPPTIGLIGRVVPIKDVKSYIRSIRLLKRWIPEITALVMGPTEEDPEYYRECLEIVEALDLADNVLFTGRVDVREYLGRLDLVVLTSISEAQPLVILEAGAAGVPCVTTDVGACSEIIMGRPEEQPPLGRGGNVVPVADPAAMAAAILELLTDVELRKQCGSALKERVCRYYAKEVIDRLYRELYQAGIETPDNAWLPPTAAGTREAA